jgi:hypothetical protein
MTDRIYALNENEVFALENLLTDNTGRVRRNAIVSAVIGILISIIPMGFLPRSGRLSVEDKSLTLIQALGFGWWFLLFVVVIGGITWLTALDKKIAGLKKDSIEREGLEMTVTVTKKYSERTPEYYCILVSNENIKNKKIVLGRDQFENFREGQTVTINVFKNSKILIE